MSSINSRVAYLKGLVNGLNIDKSTKEGRVLLEIINILYDISEEVSNLSEDQKALHKYVDEIDEEVTDLSDSIMCDDYESLEDSYDNFKEVKCPNCSESIYIDKDMFGQREDITCPNCHKKVSLILKDNDID
jgi:DNA-directed RNA polymerase subunit RPC12/RpoP